MNRRIIKELSYLETYPVEDFEISQDPNNSRYLTAD